VDHVSKSKIDEGNPTGHVWHPHVSRSAYPNEKLYRSNNGSDDKDVYQPCEEPFTPIGQSKLRYTFHGSSAFRTESRSFRQLVSTFLAIGHYSIFPFAELFDQVFISLPQIFTTAHIDNALSAIRLQLEQAEEYEMRFLTSLT
jgi:hypothetical protein